MDDLQYIVYTQYTFRVDHALEQRATCDVEISIARQCCCIEVAKRDEGTDT